MSSIKLTRRNFGKLMGLAAIIGATGYGFRNKLVKDVLVSAEEEPESGEEEGVKTICTHCAVGCGTKIVVKDGVPVMQEPWLDHPINEGGMCCKGSTMFQQLTSEKRLKSPLKRTVGGWKKIDWDTAMDEIATKLLDIRSRFGSDSVMWIGSAKVSNEEAYLFRKFAAFWGTNNVDHQARICHSTTVAGLGNTWGYGSQTNHVNDIRNSKCVFIIGSNTAECHPTVMSHIFYAKKHGAQVIVCDPRFTKTAAVADKYVRFRSGSDVPLILGLINVIFENGWEDVEFLRKRTYGLDYLKEVMANYTPEVVEDITGVPAEKLRELAWILSNNRPGTLVYSMGGTQHSNGAQVIRIYALLQLVLGNAGKPGGGVNALRGHDNVQGATDMCVLSHSLPSYYGLSDDGWKHWCNVWGVDFEWIRGRFGSDELRKRPGFTVGKWFEGVLRSKEEIDQPENIHAVVIWGHSMNSISEMRKLKEALEKVDLVVIIDVYPSAASVLPDREEGIYLLPACTQMEYPGSVTNSGRQQQWRFQVVPPLFDSRPDLDLILDFAERFGFGPEFKRSKLGPYKKLPEDVTREINFGALAISQASPPERLKGHMEYAHTFDRTSLRAIGGPYDGDYFGTPWPCWSVTVDGKAHPGTPILYDTSKSVMDGGHAFRVKWGATAPDGETLLATGGYDQFVINRLAWSKDLSREVIKDALEKGMVPSGNGRARINAWNLADPVPIHREAIQSPRPDLIAKYPTYEDQHHHYRITLAFESIQDPELVKKYPLILTTGRVVEHHGGGGTTRQFRCLVELNPEMYVEINPITAIKNGVRDGEFVWVESRTGKVKVRAKVTERVDERTVFLSYHWGGIFQGESLRDRYPVGCIPEALGDSANIVASDGYARTTQMQETKTGLCSIIKA